jgi:hypothetical protein
MFRLAPEHACADPSNPSGAGALPENAHPWPIDDSKEQSWLLTSVWLIREKANSYSGTAKAKESKALED